VKRKVYVETTIVSYLTARASRDLVAAAHQELTQEWWADHRHRFDLFVSDLVILEASKGDSSAAQRRIDELSGIPVLGLTEAARELARLFLQRKLIPEKAVEDAFHVAIATVQGMNFLFTWYCKHIANAEVRERLEAACLMLGYQMPTLCTPEQLMGD
jgi:hypothetical protein